MTRLFALILIASLALIGCAQGGSDESATTKDAPAQSATTEESAGGMSPDGGKGIGPVDHVDVSALDPALAEAGAEMFTAKCTACHKIEERYIGPALLGVTKRRRPEWILNMILNPDVMVKEDPVAKGLLAEYIAPMTNQNLTEEEAKLILTFFMQNDSAEHDDMENDEKDDSAE